MGKLIIGEVSLGMIVARVKVAGMEAVGRSGGSNEGSDMGIDEADGPPVMTVTAGMVSLTRGAEIVICFLCLFRFM